MNTFFGLVVGAALIYIIIKLHKMEELLTRLDSATNEIAADLQALRDQLKDSTTPEQKTKLESLITRLEGLGQDPENPVPDVQA